MAEGDPERLVLKMAPAAKRALKGRAATLGLTVVAYVLRLAERDGVDLTKEIPLDHVIEPEGD
jgi:hypothetical protein